MIWPDFATLVIARLTADTTLTGLLVADGSSVKIGTEEMIQRDRSMYPYVSIGLDNLTQADGFRLDGKVIEFTVQIHALANAGNVAVGDIAKRVYGNAASQSGFVPTYGLHRWVPGTVGTAPYAFTPCIVFCTDDFQDNDEDKYNYIQRYRCDMTKAS